MTIYVVEYTENNTDKSKEENPEFSFCMSSRSIMDLAVTISNKTSTTSLTSLLSALYRVKPKKPIRLHTLDYIYKISCHKESIQPLYTTHK